MNNFKVLFFVLGALILSGCATVLNGTTQSVTFDSLPQGAEILIDGALVGVTPLTMTLEKNAKDTVMVKKDGFKTISRDLTKKFDGVAVINIFWDLSTTDAITGAIKQYEPNSYYFELQAKD